MATVLALITGRLFSTPADESLPSSSTSPTPQQYPFPLPKAFRPTVAPSADGGFIAVCPTNDLARLNNRFRSHYNLGPGVGIQGLPACGGEYLLSGATGVELDFLGLDRFRDTERPPGAVAGSPDEEAHCDRMRQLGALWFPDTHTFVEWAVGDTGDSPYIKVGWPAGGGVWVLSSTEDEAGEMGVGIIHNAYNMEERCKALELLGAVFYEEPRDCPDLDLP
ncbi:hypothetical protein VPNG_04014 [Cytospora leucostoma]|uniref:Uncharacterized protein n=1 Tax=Cytospora leucostoma TaxID=1230097 RepID=A0A423XE67_9PEZI|nr:hypothetical protein VPNG_04014 [Cytospora leucostoma]